MGGPGSGVRPRRSPSCLPVTLVVGLWVWQARELDRVEDARAEDLAAVNAATRLTRAWASVDYREVDEYVEAVRDGATGPSPSSSRQPNPCCDGR